MTNPSASAPERQAAAKPWSRHTAQKRAAILDAAVTVFIRDGFHAATVDDIAALAGVGKQTVYNHFGDKHQLFLAAVEQAEGSGLDEPVDDSPALNALLSPARDPLDVLTQLGVQILGAVLDPDRAALHRLTIAELQRHPELQQMWSDTAGGGITAMLSRYLSAMTSSGQLAVADPDTVARQFVILLAGEGRTRSLHGLRALSPADTETIAYETAALIVRASRP